MNPIHDKDIALSFKWTSWDKIKGLTTHASILNTYEKIKTKHFTLVFEQHEFWGSHFMGNLRILLVIYFQEAPHDRCMAFHFHKSNCPNLWGNANTPRVEMNSRSGRICISIPFSLIMLHIRFWNILCFLKKEMQ